MIYTVTMNPAIDCTLIPASPISFGEVNRMTGQTLRFGGKGINVSYVLRGLGEESTLLGFAAGFTGDALVRGLEGEGLSCDFVRLPEGCTRVNVKIPAPADDHDSATELNAPGPAVSPDALVALEKKFAEMNPGDTVVLAGSLPRGAGAEYISRLLSALPEGAEAVCDLAGEALRAALPHRPLLVKPNVPELCEFLGLSVTDVSLDDVHEGAARLMDLGAKNVLVTMGAEGAVFASASGARGRVPVPVMPPVKGDVVLSSVGCGDSAVAGWICGYGCGSARKSALHAAGIPGELSREEAAARLAVLCGTASYRFGFPASIEKAALFGDVAQI